MHYGGSFFNGGGGGIRTPVLSKPAYDVYMFIRRWVFDRGIALRHESRGLVGMKTSTDNAPSPLSIHQAVGASSP